MIVLKVKTLSGETADLRIEELVSIDGAPYRQAEETKDISAQIARLDGRLSVIERAIFPPRENDEVTSNG